MKVLINMRGFLLAALAATIIRLLHWSIRWRYQGLTDEWRNDTQKIIPFWHERLLMAHSVFRAVGGAKKRKAYALSSRHRDGQTIAQAMRFLGLNTVFGSTSKGSVSGLLGLINAAKSGGTIGITPDGPRGPSRVLKAGVIEIAKASGVAIYPLAFSAERRWRLGSWDKMVIPKPFSRGVVFFGGPIHVPKDASDEQMKELSILVKLELDKISDAADNFQY